MAKKSKVAELLSKFQEGESRRFSRTDFEKLVHMILTDVDYEAEKKKYNLAKKEKNVTKANYAQEFRKLLGDLLKHAGVKTEEREAIVEKYEPKPKDLGFLIDALEEAEFQYVESGKALNKWTNHSLNLTLKKTERKGKFAGEITLSRKLRDNEKALKKQPGTGKPVPRKKK